MSTIHKKRRLTDAELEAFKACTTTSERVELCVAIKACRNGLFPLDFFKRIVAEGIVTAAELAAINKLTNERIQDSVQEGEP